jgi:hypothetical protein
MKSDNGEICITQLPLGMNYFDTSSKVIYCVFVVHLSIIFTYPIIELCLQLVQIIVCKPQGDVCSYKG